MKEVIEVKAEAKEEAAAEKTTFVEKFKDLRPVRFVRRHAVGVGASVGAGAAVVAALALIGKRYVDSGGELPLDPIDVGAVENLTDVFPGE